MSDTFLGAIADDFAGATELAAMLSRVGVPVGLRVGVPGGATGSAPFEVIALDIRTAPPEDAVAQARAAARWLGARGARRIYWRYAPTFASTARGNIGPVAEALLSDLRTDRTMHCPASPGDGRRVFMGNLHLDEVPLDETPMRDHPATPMRDANLVRLLRPQVRRDAGLLAFPTVRAGPAAIAAALAGRTGHVVADAVETADLEALAEAVEDWPLLCGGAAFAQALGLRWRSGLVASRAPAPLGPGGLVLSGSSAPATRAQVGAFLERADGYRLDPLELHRHGQIEDARAWLRARDPAVPKIVFATAEPQSVRAAQEALGSARAGAIIDDALARLAADARQMGTARILVVGGGAGIAVLRALEIDHLAVGAEIAPGIAWCLAPDGTALAFKPGDAGPASFLTEALDASFGPGAVAAQ